MSKYSPVFHTVVTVRIGLRTQLEWELSFHKISCIEFQQEKNKKQNSSWYNQVHY